MYIYIYISRYIKHPNACGQHRHRACTTPTPTPTPHDTTPHHTLKFTKNTKKIEFGSTQNQQQIEENHVPWHPWAIPGHSWALLGRPWESKGEKVTKDVVRSPQSRDLFWSTFRYKII